MFLRIFMLLCLLNFSLITPCYAAKKSKHKPMPVSLPVKTVLTEDEIYQKAQDELEPEIYKAYRVIERLLRANNLDEYPWTIEFHRDKQYKFNSETSEGNLILIYDGVSSTFSDDISAYAFIIGHEIAHQVQKHNCKASKYKNEVDNRFQKDQNTIVSQLDNYLDNNSIATDLLKYYVYNQIKTEQENIDKLKEENQLDYLQFLRKCEYEADEMALKYLVQAGFDPNGAIRAFKFMERFPSFTENESDHPLITNRNLKVKIKLKSLDLKSYKNKGNLNVKTSKPLTYKYFVLKNEKNVIKKSLLIHSRRGTNQPVNKQFKDLFGK